MLEFVNHFPDFIGSGQEISLPSKIQNRDVLFAIADTQAVKTFQLYEEIFCETAAYMGFPTIDGKGCTLLIAGNAFGIIAGSGNKSGAWTGTIAYYEKCSGCNNRLYRGDRYKGKFGTLIYNDGWCFTGHGLT